MEHPANVSYVESARRPGQVERPRRVVVAQLGARRHYAVPSTLYEAGCLDQLVTDLYLKQRSSVALAGILRLWRPSTFSRLAARRSATLPDDVVRSFPLFALQNRLQVNRARSAGARTDAWLRGGTRFCNLAATLLRPSQDTIYAYTSAAKELFVAGRERGMRLVLDHATAPRRHEMRLVAEEAERFAGWAALPQHDHRIDEYHQRQIDEAALADAILCASSFARRSLIEEGVPAKKIMMVPLGIASHFFDVHAAPGTASRLRVLFVGSDGLRKGIGYLAEAKRRLRSPSVAVKVVGDLELSRVALDSLAADLDLLGPVPRAQIVDLYRWADVLVLPSVSDTFGLVVLEAMAAGIPVIASVNTCGPDVIRDGLDGFLVPIRDANAIVDKLDLLASDLARLKEMGQSARRRARAFAGGAYAERLLAAVAGQ